jgi:UDP-3-O-[3-hydroxymyristoyl] N-acetylglucosamine deacetylase
MFGQRTLRTSIRASGVGLHSGSQVIMTVHPAPPDRGIVFRRTDLTEPVDIPARPENVGATQLGTVLSQGETRVSTIEHLMSAFAGLGIDNAVVAALNGASPRRATPGFWMPSKL